MARPHHIVFACGGITANLYPGLAVAARVVERLPNARLTFVGAGRALAHAVQAAGFRSVQLPSQPAPQNALGTVRFLTDNVAGYLGARWFLREQRAGLVVGLGGFACAATVRAAVSAGIPTVLLEQNAVPDQVTNWLAPSASAVCVGFAESRRHFAGHVSTVVTGNPARPAFERLYRLECARVGLPAAGYKEQREKLCTARQPRVVVIGGAGGARTINESLPAAVQRLGAAMDGWQIVHQSGEGQLQETAARYREAGIEAVVVAFIDEMASVLFDSDIVVCRAAGTTLAELALAGVPAVLVPHPLAPNEQQMANARIFAAGGAAAIIDEAATSGPFDEVLADGLRPLLANVSRRQAMAANMRRLAKPDAAAEITDTICEVLSIKSQRLAA
jgi:UDP-N-acetylglucosamine--N-acetylmuramyl-(pentapeptide) pyrophosphoryl-undecaprenol N-acetylglucosamine transferase